MRVGPQEGGLPDSVPGPVEWLSQLGSCLFWAGDGLGGHVYVSAYVCAGCMCVYLYICMHICAQAHMCVGMYICKKKSVCTFTYL